MTNLNNKNNWRTALAEAAYMTGLERSAGVVQMTSYSPLLAHAEGWQWKPDLIWFDNLGVMPTPNYQVQKLCSTNSGNIVVPIYYKNKLPAAGQDSLYATATIDTAANELIVKIVNAAAKSIPVNIVVKGAGNIGAKAKLVVLHNDDLEVENSFASAGLVAQVETMVTTKGNPLLYN